MKRKMKKLMMGLASLALGFGLVGTALAANSDNHTVTIDVQAIDELAITGGNVTLTINAANATGFAAGDSSFSVSNTATSYGVTTNSAANKKITAQTSAAYTETGMQLFITLASASGVGGGTEVEITSANATAVDMITGLLQEADSSQTITYRAVATLATPIATSSAKTVTLTLVTQ